MGPVDMNWLAKALLQKCLGPVPFGEDVNYLLQRRVTRTLPMSDDQLFRKVKQAQNHFRQFTTFSPGVNAEDARFYEFGAGWELTVPLIYFCLGVRNQIITDLMTRLRFPLINDSIRRLARSNGEFDSSLLTLRDGGTVTVQCREDLLGICGIKYQAPADARATGLPSEYFDFISNTHTL